MSPGSDPDNSPPVVTAGAAIVSSSVPASTLKIKLGTCPIGVTVDRDSIGDTTVGMGLDDSIVTNQRQGWRIGGRAMLKY